MKSPKRTFLLYAHGVLLLWALLFILSLSTPGCGKVARALAFGQFFFLLINIPLSIFTLILNAKEYFGSKLKRLVTILSAANIVIGAADWCFLIMVLSMP